MLNFRTIFRRFFAPQAPSPTPAPGMTPPHPSQPPPVPPELAAVHALHVEMRGYRTKLVNQGAIYRYVHNGKRPDDSVNMIHLMDRWWSAELKKRRALAGLPNNLADWWARNEHYYGPFLMQ